MSRPRNLGVVEVRTTTNDAAALVYCTKRVGWPSSVTRGSTQCRSRTLEEDCANCRAPGQPPCSPSGEPRSHPVEVAMPSNKRRTSHALVRWAAARAYANDVRRREQWTGHPPFEERSKQLSRRVEFSRCTKSAPGGSRGDPSTVPEPTCACVARRGCGCEGSSRRGKVLELLQNSSSKSFPAVGAFREDGQGGTFVSGVFSRISRSPRRCHDIGVALEGRITRGVSAGSRHCGCLDGHR